MKKKTAPRAGTVSARKSIVRLLRNQKNLSIEQLADKAGISGNTLKKIEAGDAVLPDKLVATANALDVKYDFIRSNTLADGRIRLHISAEIPEEFDLVKFLSTLADLVGWKRPPSDPTITDGSIWLGLTMKADDIARASKAYLDGKLMPLDVMELYIVTISDIREIRRIIQTTRRYSRLYRLLAREVRRYMLHRTADRFSISRMNVTIKRLQPSDRKLLNDLTKGIDKKRIRTKRRL